ncbi:MAG: hypothetical protein V4620_07375 [Bacteroidota bacterium]
MKKITHWIIAFVVSIFVSCGNEAPKEQAKTVEPPQIYGHWLLESVLNHVYKTKNIHGFDQFLCSEIIIDKNADSIILVNGDVEFWKSGFDSISLTEIAVEGLSHMPHSNLFVSKDDKLFYYDSAAKKTFTYVRAINNPIVKVNSDLPALKYAINKHLFEGEFTDLANNYGVKFTAMNEINGIDGYQSYQTFINNDKASMSENDLMEISNITTKESKLLIWEAKGDTIQLYEAMNTECKTCKPFYEKGKQWKTFLRKVES